MLRTCWFGPAVAQRLRHCRPRPSGCWHLDEMVARIAGETVYLWRAVDHEGEVLDILVQRGRDKAAALKLMRTLLKKQGFAPTVIVTDKLRSYPAAFAGLGLAADHERGLRQNNRAEVSHQPVRRRERKMQAVQVSRICSALPRHACRRPQHLQCSTPSDLPPPLRLFRAEAMQQWHAATMAA
jgi:putative transposase